MLNSSVLVLNRSYLPIHVTSVRRAFSLLYQGVAKVVDEQYQTFNFDEWSQLAVARDMDAIGTPSGAVRVPRVVVLVAYDRLPKRHVRFSRINLMARDDFQCQYCGEKPARSELNLDHVVPRALGGRSTWENVVTSCVECNRRKGGPHATAGADGPASQARATALDAAHEPAHIEGSLQGVAAFPFDRRRVLLERGAGRITSLPALGGS